MMLHADSRVFDADGTSAGLLVEQARQAERLDLAREMHDTVVQPIAALVESFRSLQQQSLAPGIVEAYLTAWTELAQEALDSLRDTLAGLRLHPLAGTQLPDALLRYVAPYLRGRGLRLLVEGAGWPNDLPIDWTTQLYLTIREALTNVEKHAHASEITVLFKTGAKQLWVIVADNGTGFNTNEVAASTPRPRGSGFGLDGMRERVERLGGTLTLYSSLGHGTQIHMRLPRPTGPGHDQTAEAGGSANSWQREVAAGQFGKAAPPLATNSAELAGHSDCAVARRAERG